jgi:hypothetical protein
MGMGCRRSKRAGGGTGGGFGFGDGRWPGPGGGLWIGGMPLEGTDGEFNTSMFDHYSCHSLVQRLGCGQCGIPSLEFSRGSSSAGMGSGGLDDLHA